MPAFFSEKISPCCIILAFILLAPFARCQDVVPPEWSSMTDVQRYLSSLYMPGDTTPWSDGTTDYYMNKWGDRASFQACGMLQRNQGADRANALKLLQRMDATMTPGGSETLGEFGGTGLIAARAFFGNLFDEATATAVDHALFFIAGGQYNPGRDTGRNPDWTNYALMNALLLHYCGSIFNNSTWSSAGAERMANIQAAVLRDNCDPEHNSTTYEGVAMTVLAVAAKVGRDADFRAMAVTMKDVLWKDIALHYNASMRNLSGPYYRAYGGRMDFSRGCVETGMAILAYTQDLETSAGAGYYGGTETRFCILNGITGLGTPADVPDAVEPALLNFQGSRRFTDTYQSTYVRYTHDVVIEEDQMAAVINSYTANAPYYAYWSPFFPSYQLVMTMLHWKSGIPGGATPITMLKIYDSSFYRTRFNSDGDIEVLMDRDRDGAISPLRFIATFSSATPASISATRWDMPGQSFDVVSSLPAPTVSVSGEETTIYYDTSAAPTNTVVLTLKYVKTPTHNWLGGQFKAATLLEASSAGAANNAGLYVTQMDSGSAGHTAGLRVKDIVTAANGQAVKYPEDLFRAIRAANGGSVSLTVRRGGGDVIVPLDSAVPQAVAINATSTPAYAWRNSRGGTWSTALNWRNGAVPTTTGSDTVSFADADLIFNSTLTLDASPTVGGLVFGDAKATNDWLVTGSGSFNLAPTSGAPTIEVINQTTTLAVPLSGSAGFRKTGAGRLVLTSQASTYSGAIIVENGGLIMKSGGPSLSGNNSVTLAAGTTLDLDGANMTVSDLTVSGSATVLIGNATLSVNGSLNGSGSLTNNGTLDLSGTTGVSSNLTLVNNGQINLPSGAVTVKRLFLNGVLQQAGTVLSATTNPGSFSGSGTIVALEDVGIPANLTATATLGKIALTWSPADVATSYIVRRSTVSGGTFTQLGTVTGTSFTDTAVANGITYFYTVTAYASGREGIPSSEVSAVAIAPLYFDPNGTTSGSVSNNGSYTWTSASWAGLPGGNNTVSSWSVNATAQFAATNPGSPLNYSVSLTGFTGASHSFKRLINTAGTLTFTGTPGNFYFLTDSTITTNAGAVTRFTQNGTLAFNLNRKMVTFDGDGNTIVGDSTVIMNTGNIMKTGNGTLVLTAANTYLGSTTISGGTLRLAATDLPTLWLDATLQSSLTFTGSRINRWNDANSKATYASQSTEANQPTLTLDTALSGPSKTFVDFGAYSASPGNWMQFSSAMTDIRAVFWVGETTNDNFILGSATTYHFHSGGTEKNIWNGNTKDLIRDGTTWLNGAAVTGNATLMPAYPTLVRLGVFPTGAVAADTLAKDRAIRYGGERIGEVLIFNTVLTAQQQSAIDSYLAKKWSGTGTGVGDRLPTTTAVTLANGATLDLTGINFQTIAALNADDDSNTKVILGAANLTISGNATCSFDGTISGTGSLTKNGTGSLILTGTNSYTGTTALQGGTLQIDGSISSDVTVKSGTTLINNGAISGNITVENGGFYQGSGSVSGGIYSPLDKWRLDNFGTTSNTGNAADAADPDGDSYTNAEEYANGTSPLSVNAPTVTVTSPVSNPVYLPSTSSVLRLGASVTSGSAPATISFLWSKVSGTGDVTFDNPNSTNTRATFSAPGIYEIHGQETVVTSLSTASANATLKVFVAATEPFTLRQGVNGYSHTATFIRSDNQTWNSGARTDFLLGRNSGTFYRGLFAFDLASVPTGFIVQTAQLDLWTGSAGAGVNLSEVKLHKLYLPPTEGTGAGLSTANADTGTNWTRRTDSTENLNWQGAGCISGNTTAGDYDSTMLSSVTGFSPTEVNTQKTFATSSAFAAAAGSARSAGIPLSLLLISPATEAGATSYARLHSDDSATVEMRPLLTLGVRPAATLPVVSAGTAPAAVNGVASSLAGNATDATSVAWTQVVGPGTATLGNATSATTSVVFNKAGTYVLRLSAANAFGETSSDLTITVATNPAAVFADWQESNWPGITDSAIIGPMGDPDGDGIANLIEFTLGTAPKAGNVVDARLEAVETTIKFVYTRSRAANGISCHVEWSDTLASDSWSTGGVSETDVSPDPRSALQTIRATLPAGTGPKRFVRLKVSQP